MLLNHLEGVLNYCRNLKIRGGDSWCQALLVLLHTWKAYCAYHGTEASALVRGGC
jgi:hypothetical protein